MPTRKATPADLDVSAIAAANGISQSKVKEIATALSVAEILPTAESIAEVVKIYTAERIDPLDAVETLAKRLHQTDLGSEDSTDPFGASVNSIADQVYAGLAPLTEQVKDAVTARFAVEIAGGILSGESIRKPGAKTKSVLSAFASAARSVNLGFKTPSLDSRIDAGKSAPAIGGDDDFLSLPPSSPVSESVAEVA